MLGRSSVQSGGIAGLLLLGTIAAAQMAPVAPATGAPTTTVLLAWGDNSNGELGNGGSDNSDTPLAVTLPAGVTPVAAAAGGGGGDPAPAQWADYTIGSDHHLYAWGDNSSGELGNGSSGGSSDTPVEVSLPSGVTPTALSAGQGVAYAAGSDGNLYAWGTNAYGNLGDGGSADSSTPVTVSLPSGVTPTAVAAGYESAYAIGSDGNLYAWGDNFYGELGDGGSEATSPTPVTVALPSGVTPKAIAGGGGTAYAIGSDGNLYAWGLNASGQLGNGTTNNSSTPVVVALPSGVHARTITAGGGFAHAIGSDGNLYAWGLDDTAGQLGDGGGSDEDTPIVVSLAPGVTAEAVADNLHSGYAVGSDGTIYAWGYGLAGELGNGSDANFSPPVPVTLPSGAVPVALSPEPGAAGGLAIVSLVPTAPKVVTQPAGQSVIAGESATFSAAASGYPAPSAQWQVSTDGGKSFSPVSGATSDSLTVADTTVTQNGDEYEAVFANGTSPVATTDPATLTVQPTVAPAITLDPVSQSIYEGESVTFTAAAGGVPAPSVQWEVSTGGGASYSPVPDGTGDSLTVSDVSLAQSGDEYEAVYSNGVSPDATSSPAVLTVLPAVAPVVTLNPTDVSVVVGEPVTFSAGASGTPAPTVEWQVSIDGGKTWVPAPALQTPTFTGTPPAFLNGWEFRAVFSNGGGSATTTAATLTLLPAIAPVITTQPVSRTIPAGGTVTFSAGASGTPAPTVEWQVSIDGGKTWVPAPALQTPTFTGTPPAFLNGWEFRAVFSNSGGSAVTDPASLTIT